MEKVLYLLTRPPGTSTPEMRGRLLDRVSEDLVEAGALAVQVNVVDEAVTPADGLRIVTSPSPPTAVVSVWIPSANDRFREPFDRVLASESGAVAAHLVTESVPLTDTRPGAPGERTEGFSQIAFLRRPKSLPVDEWIDTWLNSHTQVALDTQDTYLYVQNVVVRALTTGATAWDAIVEEGFPADAMNDAHAFFDARGDDDRLADHQRVMFESVQRFVDLEHIDVIPTSRYVTRELRR